MRKFLLLIFTLTIAFADGNSNNKVVYDTSDICRGAIIEDGCVKIPGFDCRGGIGCKKIIPVKNTTDTPLKDVRVFYKHNGLGGSVFSKCGVEPGGSCSEEYQIDLGKVGILSSATEFNFSNEINKDTDSKVWVKSLSEAYCLNSDNFYVEYVKNGVIHRGKLGICEVEVKSQPFDAWDSDKNINNRIITTKISNKEFSLTIASINKSNDGYEANPLKDVYYRLIDKNTSTPLTKWKYTNFSSSKIISLFLINKAYRDVRVQFKFCQDRKGNVVNTSYCNTNLVQYDWNTSTYSSDNFAIRPDRFIIDNLTSPIKAGEEFNLTFKAVDYNNLYYYNRNTTLEYNESLNSSFKIKTKDNKCLTGNLSISNFSFADGKAETNLTYSEVGDINITIQEINGSEFAKVDEDDTNDTQRLIKPSSIILSFIPHHFKIDANYNNYKDGNFTYISNDLNMSSILELNITAKNKQNKTTTNYNTTCYAQNVDVNVSYTNESNLSPVIYQLENEIELNTTTDINFSINKSYFNSGIASVNIKINFEKNYSNPVNEFNFTINEINASDINNTFGKIDDLNESVTFRYAALFAKNITVSDKTKATNNLKYYYWKNGWVINKDHNSSIFGDINISKSIIPDKITLTKGNLVNGEEDLNVSTTHSLPYSAKIHLSISSWLWYHPLTKEYKDPSSSNLDCLTHPCFKVTFLKSSSKGWAGIGNDDSKYNEKNKTVELNATKSINTQGIRKINW